MFPNLNAEQARKGLTNRDVAAKLELSRVTYENRKKKGKDIPRNHTNYGIVTKCADVLRFLGQEVEIPCYGDGEYLKIPKVVIDGKETAYHNG
ncbi:hypothetical protein FACS18949_06110 [Clostridia bacterium]|nr:hypothetical protein FACS189425_08300 [Clostridia bacterium]GHV33082.1 hypothetical protein FACS18949_06110 [Clostridia bacterium]